MTTPAPSFLKVFLPDLYSKCLLLPPAFGEHFSLAGGDSLGMYFLRGPSGNEWKVRLESSEELMGEGADRGPRRALFFGEGWAEFCSDHSLEAGEFLVFVYDASRSLFYVSIFDRSSCEKESAFHAVPAGAGIDPGQRRSKKDVTAVTVTEEVYKRKRWVTGGHKWTSGRRSSREAALHSGVSNSSHSSSRQRLQPVLNVEQRFLESESMLLPGFPSKGPPSSHRYPKGQPGSRHSKHWRQIQAENYHGYQPDERNYVMRRHLRHSHDEGCVVL